MFFGKTESDKVRLDSLQQLLDLLFEKKLGNLALKAAHIINELERSRPEFYRLCNELRVLDAEPYVEDLWNPNPSPIKSKKEAYAIAIRQIMEGAVLSPDMKLNSYDRYRGVLLSIDSTVNEVMKANASYKIVLYCYSRHMKSFKSAFSMIDMLRERLRRELGAHERKASEYASLKEHISRLKLSVEEIKGIEDSEKALRDRVKGSKDAGNRDMTALVKDLDVHKAELSEINLGISRLSDRISLITLPLSRSARKLDHVSIKKKHLSAAIIDPIGNIADESDYKEFRELVQELKASMEKGVIEVKNREELLGTISEVLDTDIYSMINELRSMKAKKSAVEGEMATLEIALSDIRKVKTDSEKILQDISTVEDRKKEILRAREMEKAETERLFSSYYRKAVVILL